MKNMIITIKGNDYEISDDKNCWKELADIAWDIALSLDKFEKGQYRKFVGKVQNTTGREITIDIYDKAWYHDTANSCNLCVEIDPYGFIRRNCKLTSADCDEVFLTKKTDDGIRFYHMYPKDDRVRCEYGLIDEEGNRLESKWVHNNEIIYEYYTILKEKLVKGYIDETDKYITEFGEKYSPRYLAYLKNQKKRKRTAKKK